MVFGTKSSASQKRWLESWRVACRLDQSKSNKQWALTLLQFKHNLRTMKPPKRLFMKTVTIQSALVVAMKSRWFLSISTQLLAGQRALVHPMLASYMDRCTARLQPRVFGERFSPTAGTFVTFKNLGVLGEKSLSRKVLVETA